MDKQEEEIKVGDIRPIYNVAGFQVCKVTADKPEDSEWIQVEKVSEAEILSNMYRNNLPVKTKKKAGRPKTLDKEEGEGEGEEENTYEDL